jgi:hypothetical protein
MILAGGGVKAARSLPPTWSNQLGSPFNEELSKNGAMTPPFIFTVTPERDIGSVGKRGKQV